MAHLRLLPVPAWDALDRAQVAFECAPSVETAAALATMLVAVLAQADVVARYAARLGGRPSES
jgi:hypothetical protein